jgi:hypothetical protein
MIHLNPEDPPYLVGHLPSHIDLPCVDGTRSVHLSYRTFRHICDRRENEHPEHLALVLSRISMVVAGDLAGVLVSLKCLAGETWVSTAFPMGTKSLRKHISNGRLRLVSAPEGRKVTATPCRGTVMPLAGSKEMEE